MTQGSDSMSDLEKLLEPAPPALGTDTSKNWPAGPAKPDHYYGFTFTDGSAMVAMLQDTWVKFGTDMERMRRAARDLDTKCKDLAAENARLHAEHDDLRSRHQAITEQLRKHRLEKAEQQIIVPDAAGKLRKLSDIKR